MYAQKQVRKLSGWVLAAIATLTLGAWRILPTAVADRPGPPPPDTTPPAAVTTLAAATAAQGAVRLTWTAVGDDGGAPGGCSGTASSYDVRYSTVAPADPPFNGDVNAWFAAAASASGEPAPRPCNISESFCLGGLSDGVVYHVALRVSDEAGNTSGVSNVATAMAGMAVGESMHVSDVNAGWTYAAGPKKRPNHFVSVQDEFGAPVEGATVTVNLSGCTSETGLTAITDCGGRAWIVGVRTINCSNTPCCFVVAVTNVSRAGLAYDASSNAENCAVNKCNPFSDVPCAPCE